MDVIIVDDEQKSRATVKLFLKKHFENTKIIAEAQTLAEADRYINDLSPDLLFLDIRLPDGNSFRLLEELPAIDFEIIFITAFNEYAINAFNFSAVDYLLKPINEEKFVNAVDRARSNVMNTHIKQRFEVLLAKVNESDLPPKISLPTFEGYEFVFVKDIIRCFAKSNYTYFVMKNGEEMIVSKTLKEYEDLLTPYRFCRVHHKHLINLQHLKKYVKGAGGYVIMSDDSHIDIASRRKQHFLNMIQHL